MNRGTRVWAGLLLVCAACSKKPEGSVKIAVDLPLTGDQAGSTEPIANGVRLAIDDAGGTIGDYEIEFVEFDHGREGGLDQDAGVGTITDIVADEQILAVVGPFNSGIAEVQIPISNEAGLFQCSPSNTNPGLTLPEEGADDLRSGPNNYVRVVTHDGIQGPAGAAYMKDELAASSVYIIDDADVYGVGLADAFEAQFIADGGTVTAHDSADPETANYGALLTAAAAASPGAIFFGGITANGAPDVAQAAADAGLGAIPFMSGDGIIDGPGDSDGSFINLAGADADDTYGTLAGAFEYEGQADFEAAYEEAYGGESPTGSYAPQAYACAQVALAAIEHALEEAKPKDWAEFRAAVREAGVATDHEYDTVLGTIHFDENGDTNQKIISILQVDAAAAEGAGDWVYLEAFDFGAN